MSENVDTTSEKEEAEKVGQEVEIEAEDNVEELKTKKESKKASDEEPKEKPVAEEENYKEKFYYLAAEMENLRKRFDREKQNLIKYGNEKVLQGLLDVLDNLDRTVVAIESDEDEKVKNIVTGIKMVQTMFLQVLKDNGLEPVESLGKPFDPNFHEAMAQQPAEGKEDGEIIQEYQKGYMLNGRLLRAAKVIVVKN